MIPKISLSAKDLKIIFLSALGGSLEFYDFIIYIFFSNELSQLFFPKANPFIATIEVYAVFAIGYLVRPLGGLVFSHFGDKYGRKKTFTTTLIMMALPTILIGLLPTYTTIGVLAPCLLILLRIMQGLSVGGEIPGAITFAGEHASPKHRGLTCAIIFFGIDCGLILGACVAALITTLYSQEQVLAWGWRIPFLLGGLLGIMSIHLRRKLIETPIFQITQQNANKPTYPILEVLRHHRREVFQGVTLAWMDAVITSLLFLYLPVYLTSVLHYPKEFINTMNTLALIVNGITFLALGWLSDYIGRRIFLLVGSLSFIIFGYGFFYLLAQQQTIYVFIVMSAIALISACISGIYTCAIIELFPTNVRYTGIAVSYNIGYAFFGGLTPLIATSLISITGNILSPSYYLIGSAMICFASALFLKSKHRQQLV